MRPVDGAVLYSRDTDSIGYYVASRDAVLIRDDLTSCEVRYEPDTWDLTRDRKLTEMQVAELCWNALHAYRRMMGRQTPDWSMLRDGQRIGFLRNGDVMTKGETALVAAIKGAFCEQP